MFRRFYSSRYKFYDLVLQTPSRPKEPIEAALMKPQELHDLKKKTKTVFEGNYSLDISPEQRIEKIFGGRIRGDERQSSSRLTRGEPRNIAGMVVPDKPPEPDNCCMSGCINCVWELYRDDVKEWNEKRREAARLVNQQNKDFIWPLDFHPPIKHLNVNHIPQELRYKKEHLTEEIVQKDDTWSNVPIAIRVFAEAEKKIKAKHKKQ